MANRLGMLAAAAVLLAGASFGGAERTQLSSITSGPVPPYHATTTHALLAKTLPPSMFPNDPTSERAYAVAAKIKPLLYQMPCYCHCDKELGHSSLLSCYQDRHASICGTCKMELYYAYMGRRKGMTAKQIRAGIIRGDWVKVDMSKWAAPYPDSPSHSVKPPAAKN